MLIIINKQTKKVIANHGTNSLYPDGNIPNVIIGDSEIAIRIHDSSEQAKSILLASEYYFDENNNPVVTKTIEQLKTERENSIDFKKEQILKQLQTLDAIVTRSQENQINFMVENHNYKPYQTEIDTIQQKIFLRGKLKELK